MTHWGVDHRPVQAGHRVVFDGVERLRAGLDIAAGHHRALIAGPFVQAIGFLRDSIL